MKISQIDGIATLAVSQFSVGIEGIFLPGQHVGLGFLLGFTDLGRFLRAGEDIFQGLKISVKIENQLLVGNFSGGLGRVLVVQFRLGLALETGIRMFNGNHSRHTVSDIRTGEIVVFFLEDTQLSRVGVHQRRKCRLKTGEVGSALSIVDVVAEAQDRSRETR